MGELVERRELQMRVLGKRNLGTRREPSVKMNIVIKKRKEVMIETTHGDDVKDASQWWNANLNQGCIANMNISNFKEKNQLI